MTQDPTAGTGNALRAVSDGLLADLDHLSELESAKRSLKPGDPKLVDVSTEIERLATHVLGLTIEERVLSEQADVEVALSGSSAPTATIEATKPRSAREIIDAWRDAERRAERAAPGSPEAAELATEIERLRTEYRATLG
jgi:hypothetical protein